MIPANATELDPPDSHRVRAAEGWLGLGLATEARQELAGITPDNQLHPAALRVKWEVLAALQDWDAAYETALLIIDRAPREPAGWIHRAYAARRMTEGSLEKAFKALYPALDLFPDELLIPYNLACYCCQLNRLPEARIWLQRALRIQKQPKARDTIKRMALADSDLAPLREEIQAL